MNRITKFWIGFGFLSILTTLVCLNIVDKKSISNYIYTILSIISVSVFGILFVFDFIKMKQHRRKVKW